MARLIIQDFPQSVFVDNKYVIQLYLVDNNVNNSIISKNLRLKLLYEDNEEIAQNVNPIKINNYKQNNIVTNKNKVEFVMLETSTIHSNKKFKFRLDVINEPDITPIYSDSFFVVQYQLKLYNTVPSIWYKDEGGKRNNITLNIILADQYGNPISLNQRQVVLDLAILYDDYSSVNLSKQENLLSIMSDQHQVIDKNGYCTLMVRINNISKNHNKRSFIIHIYPDLSKNPQNSDIAGCYTPAIKVKSKRPSKRSEASGMDITSLLEPSKRLHTLPMDLPMNNILLNIMRYINESNQLLTKLSFQPIGYDKDSKLEICRCPCCWAYKDNRTMDREESMHVHNCALQKLLSQWDSITLQLQSLTSKLSAGSGNPPSGLQSVSSLTFPLTLSMSNSSTESTLMSLSSQFLSIESVYAVLLDPCFITNNLFPAIDNQNTIIGGMKWDTEKKLPLFSLISNEEATQLNMICTTRTNMSCIVNNGTTPFIKEIEKYMMSLVDQIFNVCYYNRDSKSLVQRMMYISDFGKIRIR